MRLVYVILLLTFALRCSTAPSFTWVGAIWCPLNKTYGIDVRLWEVDWNDGDDKIATITQEADDRKLKIYKITHDSVADGDDSDNFAEYEVAIRHRCTNDNSESLVYPGIEMTSPISGDSHYYGFSATNVLDDTDFSIFEKLFEAYLNDECSGNECDSITRRCREGCELRRNKKKECKKGLEDALRKWCSKKGRAGTPFCQPYAIITSTALPNTTTTTTEATTTTGNSNTIVIIGVLILILALAIIVVLFICCRRKKKTDDPAINNDKNSKADGSKSKAKTTTTGTKTGTTATGGTSTTNTKKTKKDKKKKEKKQKKKKGKTTATSTATGY